MISPHFDALSSTTTDREGGKVRERACGGTRGLYNLVFSYVHSSTLSSHISIKTRQTVLVNCFHLTSNSLKPQALSFSSITMAFDLTSYKLLSFDIYGTLVDWESGIYTSLLPLIQRLPTSSPYHPSNNIASQNRHFLLTEYTKLEQSIQKAEPTLTYPLVLTKIYAQLANSLSIPISPDEASNFGTTIGTWPAFPDTVTAMQSLSKHYKLVVLSNVDKASFARTLSGPLSGVHFDAIYTAEDIGSYKPDLKNFAYLVEHAQEEFGVKKEQILKVAQSLFHDHVPAKTFGLRPSVWIRRMPGGEEALMGSRLEEVEGRVQLAATFGSLGELAEVVEKAFGDA